jgi:hypothetical protein
MDFLPSTKQKCITAFDPIILLDTYHNLTLYLILIMSSAPTISDTLPTVFRSLLKGPLRCGSKEIALFQRFGLRNLNLTLKFCDTLLDTMVQLFTLDELLMLPTLCFICKIQILQIGFRERHHDYCYPREPIPGVLKWAGYLAFNGSEMYVRHLQQEDGRRSLGYPFQFSATLMCPFYSVSEVDWSAWIAASPCTFHFKSEEYTLAMGWRTPIHRIFDDHGEDTIGAIDQIPCEPLGSLVEHLEGTLAPEISRLRGGGAAKRPFVKVEPEPEDDRTWRKRHCTTHIKRAIVKIESFDHQHE